MYCYCVNDMQSIKSSCNLMNIFCIYTIHNTDKTDLILRNQLIWDCLLCWYYCLTCLWSYTFQTYINLFTMFNSLKICYILPCIFCRRQFMDIGSRQPGQLCYIFKPEVGNKWSFWILLINFNWTIIESFNLIV